MEQLLYFLPALACPLGMGLMTWLMMRGGRHGATPSDAVAQEHELARLRAHLEALRLPRPEAAGGTPYASAADHRPGTVP